MKNWTNSIALALTAATLTLTAACTDPTPADVAAPAEEELIELNGAMVTYEGYHLMEHVVPARLAAEQAALDEIRRTFTVEDMRNARWVERWPEIWGPDGWDTGHMWPTFALARRLDLRMSERFGKDWDADAAMVAEARKTMATELDRYVFDGHVERQHEYRASRERSLREMKERRDSLAALEVKR